MYDQFVFSKDASYYIYGYTAVGRRIAYFLRQNGYQVDGFIDRNAEELQKKSKEQIIYLEDAEISTACIIIISCRNIVTQHQVAEYLCSKGFLKLIFMAAGSHYSVEYAETIRDVWERLNAGMLPSCFELPSYRRNSSRISEEYLLQDRGENVVAWIPIELLYSKTAEESVKEFRETGILNALNLSRIEGTNDEPVVCSETLTSLFDFLLNHRGNCADYVRMYAGFSGRDMKQQSLDRMSVLRVWDYELERGIKYFIEAAASVKWNPKGYFNVIDGAHRSMYLFYRGFTKVPVSIKKEEYQQYLHKDVSGYFSTFADKFALPHPLFYPELFSKKERSHLCVALLRYLKHIRWKKDGFLDLEGRDGYFAVCMKHFGAKQVGCLVQDYSMQEMKEGAELAYAKDILFFEAEMWEKVEYLKYSAVYVKDSMECISFEKSAFGHGIIFYDKIQNGEPDLGEVIYSYFDDCGDARDVVAIVGGQK